MSCPFCVRYCDFLIVMLFWLIRDGIVRGKHNHMANTNNQFIAATFGIILATGLAVTPTEAAECQIKDLQFTCGNEATSTKEIAEALASEETAKIFADWLEKPDPFPTQMSREKFRISLEKQRGFAQVYADDMHLQYKRREISGDEYEAVRSLYNMGLKNYRQALVIYRRPDWNSTTPSKFAEDGE